MITVSVQDIQRDPLACLRRVENGETIVVLRDAQPVAEIRPVSPTTTADRPFGLCAGQFTVSQNFDQPLPDDIILKEFEGK